jgi:beta-lactamase class A
VPRNPLKKIVDNNLKGAQGTYAVVVKNMKNGQSFSYNQNRPYDTASLYKAWILASIYEKIEKGDLKEDTLLEADIAELNKEFNIPPELAEQTAGKTLYTVHDALQKMIAISDNYASLLLTHEVTYDGIDFFLLHYGMNNSHTGPV